MAQISDVADALAVFDAARQELAWAYSGDFAGVPEPMKGAVRTISEVLNEAEMRWVTSTTSSEEEKTRTVVVVEEETQIKDWLVRLREVACEMRAVARKELLLEECRVDNKQRARWLPCLPRATKTTRTVPTTIDVVAEKLEELKNQYERFGYTTGLPLATCTGTPPSPCVGGQEEITTIVTADVLVRGDDKQRIIDITTADQIVNTDDDYSPATILPIFGPPCVGKTALVRSVFGDERFRDYLKVMISMPKGWEFIVQEIFRETAIPVRSGGLCSTKYVTNLVRDELDMRNKRLLLVLDDLMGCSKEQEQDDDVLEHLRRFLYDVDSRVIAIVVTPSEAIAEYMSKTLKPYRLHPMTDGMCWEIIKGTACGLQQTRTTAGDQGEAAVSSEMMGPEIASKCSGLPLAAKALGRYYLQSSSVKLKPAEWPGEGENPDIWNIIGRGGGGGFPPAASQLPLHSLVVFTRLRQSCSSRLGAESWLSFAFCAFVLPKGKGHSLVARDLLNHWCSLGITTRQRGTSCVSELLDRSLLLRDKPSLTVAATLLTWESLMHDFASYHFGNVWVVVDRIQNGATPQSPSANKSISSSRAYMALVSKEINSSRCCCFFPTSSFRKKRNKLFTICLWIILLTYLMIKVYHLFLC
ncbi:hypothetical protein PVAP13_5KG450300 [Panicum virgatum]|uniref:NB-ARC domain-containing protein n=1 Tax=Panicum virgatum TaxID=38727 RepID=A0A8T0SQH6_PANVG|nr:hypothetical protein PVAP13_5KG450300 [Panicum virgatum]